MVERSWRVEKVSLSGSKVMDNAIGIVADTLIRRLVGSRGEEEI